MKKKGALKLNRRDVLKMGTGLVIASTAGLRVSAPQEAVAGQITNTGCAGTGVLEVKTIINSGVNIDLCNTHIKRLLGRGSDTSTLSHVTHFRDCCSSFKRIDIT